MLIFRIVMVTYNDLSKKINDNSITETLHSECSIRVCRLIYREYVSVLIFLLISLDRWLVYFSTGQC